MAVFDEISMDLWKLYEINIPDFLSEAAQTPPMQRLKQVGMNCGCEYTAFPRFQRGKAYSRYDHSLGVALIVWHFTKSPAQTLAGLFHDIATPTFAHVVDFLHGDYLTQESTEDGTEKRIRESKEIQDILNRLHLTTADVCDYHIYPIADNDSPKLSADRLEYTLGNLVQFGFGTPEEALDLYGDIFVGKNEVGEDELQFHSKEKAERFADFALRCAEVYVSDEDRYAMQMLSELLAGAISDGVVTENDLEKTEPEVIRLLQNDAEYRRRWEHFCGYHEVRTSEHPQEAGDWRMIPAKKRSIDPLIAGQGRASVLCPKYGKRLNDFRQKPQTYYVCGLCESV